MKFFEKLVSLGSFFFKSERCYGLAEGVLRKRCSENIQHIFRKTPMPKDDFNKIALSC